MIDQELKQRALTPAAKGEAAPREKILKLGKKITDVVDHKLGKVSAEDAEYWGLAGVVTDEMADIALTMKLRTPYTVEELWKMNKVTEEQKPHFQELLDQMSYIGLLEYDYGYHYDHNGRTAPPSERRYILPMFVPGSAELFNMEEDAELSGRNPRLEQHPELVDDLGRFMDYYLPTTVKLLKAYEELDKQPVEGENIKTAKQEIENTLDTINEAFENLLDSFFRNTAWDVSTDISVLKTMLAQEGLTGNKDFESVSGKEN